MYVFSVGSNIKYVQVTMLHANNWKKKNYFTETLQNSLKINDLVNNVEDNLQNPNGFEKFKITKWSKNMNKLVYSIVLTN